jgi:TonB family protein
MRARIHAGTFLLFSLLPLAVFAQDPGTPTTPQVAAPSSSPDKIRVGGNVMMQKIVKQPMPVYPQIAKQAKISGTVVLHAIIGKDGMVNDLQYISGPPLLMRAAMDAVRQWEYEPTLLNGEPMTVDATVSVVFTLNNSAPPSSPDSTQMAVPPSLSSSASNSLPDAAPLTVIDPQFKADALHMMDLMHYKDIVRQSIEKVSADQRKSLFKVFPDTPDRDKIIDRFYEKLTDLVESMEFEGGVVRIYAKYLTDDDIKALIQFYATPAGQHYNDASQHLIPDISDFGREIGARHAAGILRQLCVEYPELKGVAIFCPGDSDPDKKSLPANPAPPKVPAQGLQ